MRSFISRAMFVTFSTFGVAAVGCTADVHDNTINVDDPSIDVETDVDVENVEQGSTVNMKISASEDVVLVMPDSTPPAGKEDVAVFFKVFIDDEDSEPLVVTASLSVNVQISTNVEPGEHRLICRMFRHDGEATSSSSELKITVKASGSVTVNEPPADGGA